MSGINVCVSLLTSAHFCSHSPSQSPYTFHQIQVGPGETTVPSRWMLDRFSAFDSCFGKKKNQDVNVGGKSAALPEACGSSLGEITTCFPTGVESSQSVHGNPAAFSPQQCGGIALLYQCWERIEKMLFWELSILFLQAEAISEHLSWKYTLLSILCKSSWLTQALLGLSNTVPEA